MKKIKPPHYWHEAKKFLSKKDKKLAKIINQYDGHLVTRNDPFYSLCRAIIGQQISVKAADSIWLKFEKVIKKITPINLIISSAFSWLNFSVSACKASQFFRL